MRMVRLKHVCWECWGLQHGKGMNRISFQTAMIEINMSDGMTVNFKTHLDMRFPKMFASKTHVKLSGFIQNPMVRGRKGRRG